MSKIFGHLTSESGGRKTFKWYLKIEHTHKHTDRQTERQTNQLILSIGQEGRCFENHMVLMEF